MTYGGIYREAAIEVKGAVNLKNLFVRATDVYSENKRFEVSFDIASGQPLDNLPLSADIRIWDGEDCIAETEKNNLQLGPNTVKFISDKVKAWSVDEPNVYRVTVDLSFNEEKTDYAESTFGLREAVFRRDGFYLNGRKLRSAVWIDISAIPMSAMPCRNLYSAMTLEF